MERSVKLFFMIQFISKLRSLIFILMIIFFGLILFFSTNIIAASVNIEVVLDSEEVIAKFDMNYTKPVLVTGNVTCTISGIGEDFQYVNVNLYTSDRYDWGPGISPSALTFESDGSQKINLTFYVPSNVENRTKNRIVVHGHWQIIPCIRTTESTGDIKSDFVDAIVYRKSPVRYPTSGFTTPGDFNNMRDGFGLEIILIIILIPIIAALIAIIVYYKKIKNSIK